MVLTVDVEVPKNLNKEQKDVLEKFAEVSKEGNYKQNKSFFEKMKNYFK